MKSRATQERNEFFARRFGEALKEKHLRQTDFIRLYEQMGSWNQLPRSPHLQYLQSPRG